MSISETKNRLHATGYVSQGGNGQTGSERRPISLHATTIFKSAIRVSLKRKKREREREVKDGEYLLRNNTITRIIAPTQKPEQAVLM